MPSGGPGEIFWIVAIQTFDDQIAVLALMMGSPNRGNLVVVAYHVQTSNV
jgi:hypothetical protein